MTKDTCSPRQVGHFHTKSTLTKDRILIWYTVYIYKFANKPQPNKIV